MSTESPPPADSEAGESPLPCYDHCPITTFVYDAQSEFISVDHGDGRGPVAPVTRFRWEHLSERLGQALRAAVPASDLISCLDDSIGSRHGTTA
jgi:hypothetical protein